MQPIPYLASRFFDRVFQQFVRQRSWRKLPAHAAVDAGCFKDADHDRKLPVPVDFTELDQLLLGDFADDNPGQFHVDEHDYTSAKSLFSRIV